MSDFFFGLWMLVQGAWMAGVIYPASIKLHGVSRWKILGLGFVLSFAVAMGLSIFSDEKGGTEELGVFPILMVVVSFFWWLISIVGLLLSWIKRWQNRTAQSDVKAVAPTPPDDKYHWLKKVPGEPQRAVKRPDQTTRAIRTGWTLGDIEFTYEDAEGEVTRRRVTVHSVSVQYIKGECQDREAARTFRFDRILGDITDCETGEILSPKAYSKRMK